MNHRFWEIVLGLDKGFLDRQGEPSLKFNPHWPWQQTVGAGTWNLILAAGAVVLVIWVYRREGASRRARVALTAMRLLLVGFVLVLLNNPVLTLTTSRTEPSVLALVIDGSMSMCVPDGAPSGEAPRTRLAAITDALSDDDRAMLKGLAAKHVLKLYRFDSTARPLASVDARASRTGPMPSGDPFGPLLGAIDALKPDGQSTQIISSLRAVLDDLEGQRLAGVVIFTDGQDTPPEPLGEAMGALKSYGVKIYTIPVGSDKPPRNIQVQSVNVQDSAFKGDLVDVKATVSAAGYEPGHPVRLLLKNRRTGAQLHDGNGQPVEKIVNLDDQTPQEVELVFQADEPGTIDVTVEAEPQPGELDVQDNFRTVQVAVLDAQINVLFVDGYPRWEYRYIKNQMMREPTINISCILLSADPTFAQEGNHPQGYKYFPFKHFPETMEQIMECDVVVFGDVDPRQFTDSQLQLVSDFVSRKRGGFEMIAGPRWSPQAFRNTPIEDLLPVNISQVEGGYPAEPITTDFRPILTRDGQASSIFRFFADRARNEHYLKEEIQGLFWFCQGVTVKPGVGQVYAEHPTVSGPDGRPAPLLVVGQFGGGRTMFSAIDDSWRWRFYTGESIFDNYWIQQFRYLARSKKLGQRRVTFTSLRPAYELGEQVKLNLKVLDPTLLAELPQQVGVDLVDDAGLTVSHESLVRQEATGDLLVSSFLADRVGKFTARVPSLAAGVDAMELPVEVNIPRLELIKPEADRGFLAHIAAQTMGRTMELPEARTKLAAMIPSAAKVIPVISSQRLWDAPAAMIFFVVLLTTEWVLRKVYGML